MSWRNFLAIFKRRSKAERELDDEMRFHLEKQIELHVAAGMSPEEARRQALIEFGSVQQTRENVRETRSTHFFDVMIAGHPLCLAPAAQDAGVHFYRGTHSGIGDWHEHRHFQSH